MILPALIAIDFSEKGESLAAIKSAFRKRMPPPSSGKYDFVKVVLPAPFGPALQG
jgi:hypothetical protein